jgi:hypothetical protein
MRKTCAETGTIELAASAAASIKISRRGAIGMAILWLANGSGQKQRSTSTTRIGGKTIKND